MELGQDLFSKPFPMNVVDENRHIFKDEFVEWLGNNLHVFAEFAKQARYVKNVMRRDHYSSRTIGEWLRHNSNLREKGDGFKLNNNYFPPLSRLIMLAYPELDGMFEKRERQAQ